MYQNLAVNLWLFKYSKHSFAVLIPECDPVMRREVRPNADHLSRPEFVELPEEFGEIDLEL